MVLLALWSGLLGAGVREGEWSAGPGFAGEIGGCLARVAGGGGGEEDILGVLGVGHGAMERAFRDAEMVEEVFQVVAPYTLCRACWQW